MDIENIVDQTANKMKRYRTEKKKKKNEIKLFHTHVNRYFYACMKEVDHRRYTGSSSNFIMT